MDVNVGIQAINNGLTAGIIGGAGGVAIWLKAKGSLKAAVFRMSSSCFAFSSVYTFTSHKTREIESYNAWQRGAVSGSLAGIAFGTMHSSLPIVALGSGLVCSVGGAVLEGGLQAARDLRHEMVLARHSDQEQIKSSSRFDWLLDVDMPVWVPVRSEDKNEQHKRLAREVAALQMELYHLQQTVQEQNQEAEA
eukprot:TRINITY_DN9969_c0_g3_i2.p1 TRINITY_DN9969_c0_g3~~TRINITY_DN9969_c0_g3_i2.p1  ORF type:complete len:193 (+),score=31.20 TRINITY_DN9969_c0_g3_i2:383-961(+)